ncbi:unnamed protein product [Polarella glacialis]|uniref:Nuclear control of ATPase protein 2 n=1 Tax=Polarella glacialis TaxID=89957 RepID=A0A813G831_POLGL|nr:unnamed protein product [Polarella glacialis]
MAAYEGLPFVGRRRLRSFLARWDDDSAWMLGGGSGSSSYARSTQALLSIPGPGQGGDDHDESAFLYDYFQSQEKAYHTLLNLVGQVSVHLNYWLDWATPVHHRPLWAHQAGRTLYAAYLSLLGRKQQVSAPEKAARQFAHLNEELCRLVAYIQVSSFEVLSADHATLEDRAEALRLALNNLKRQAMATGQLAAGLSSQLSGGVRKANWNRPRRSTSRLLFDWGDACGGQLPSPTPSGCASPGKSEVISELVMSGRARLQESELALRVFVESLENFMLHAGRLGHARTAWPVYCGASVGGLCIAWAMGFSDRSARIALASRVREVCSQFFREWVFSPLTQLCFELLMRHPKDDLLVQLQELREEEASLDRMTKGFANFVDTDVAFAADIASRGGEGELELAERYFEWSMRNPISNVINGHLLESCMVQSQKMKVLLYAALYSIDSIMTQLKWDFLMAGIMPMMSLCGLGYWIVAGMRHERLVVWRRKMVRALAEVDRYLNHHVQARGAPKRQELQLQTPRGRGTTDAQKAPPLQDLLLYALGASDQGCTSLERCHAADCGELCQQVGSFAFLPGEALRPTNLGDSSALELVKVGEALSQLDALCRLASRVRLEDADWRAFRRDILDLASPELSVAQKLHVVTTMRSTYHVFDLGGH